MPRGKTRSRPPRVKLRRGTRRRVAWAAGAAGAIVLLAGFYFWVNTRPGHMFPSQGNDHLIKPDDKHVPYNSNPPTSGPHLGYIARWGVHTEPIAKELQVHNLEDGGVLVQYNCPEGCADLVLKLRLIVARYDTMVILAPYPGMNRRIALTAWTRLDAFDDFDERRIVRFIEAYRGIDHHGRSLF
jgi:hypothetical protein